MHRGKGTRACSQGGAVAIEFAIVLPIFLLLLYALVSYSVAMVQQHQLTQVTRAEQVEIGEETSIV